MPIIYAVVLFCYDEFDETPNEKVVKMSKLTKPYFSYGIKYLPEDISAFTDNNKGLLFAIIGIDVFQRCGDQFFGKFGRQPNG